MAFGFLKKIAKDAVKIGPIAFIPGAGAAVVLATGVAAVGHTHAPFVQDVKRTAHRLAQNPYIHAIAQGYTSAYEQANPAFFAKTLVAGAADEALHGKPLSVAVRDQFKKVGSYLSTKAKYAAQAAGVPPAVVPALTAASHVASGQPIPKNIVEVASGVLGATVGPEASDALEQGAALAKQAVAAAASPAALSALAAVRAALPKTASTSSPPSPATPGAVGKIRVGRMFGSIRHAFDAGVALVMAQHLQSKAFGAAQELLPPASDDSIAGKVVNAIQDPSSNLLAPALAAVQSQLPPGSGPVAQQALSKLVQTPALASLSSTDLAGRLGIPEPLARVVLASVSHEVPGAPIVHPQRLSAVIPPPTAQRGAAA